MRHIIIDQIKKSIKTKILFMLLIFMITAIVVVSVAFYNKSYSKTSAVVENKIITIIDIASKIIDGDSLKKWNGDTYIDDEYFNYITSRFTIINEADNDINLYLFIDQEDSDQLLIIDQKELHTYVDKAIVEKEIVEKVEIVYQPGDKEVIENYCKDSNKLRGVTILAPVFSSSREVTGVLIYDYQNEDLIRNIRSVNFEILNIAVILLIIGILVNYMILRKIFHPIESLVEAIDEIAKGDMTVNMEVQTADEIGRIKKAVNHNVNAISTIIRYIKSSSNQVNIASRSIMVSSQDAIEALNELSNSINRINDMTGRQRQYSTEISEILENLSDDGENIYNQISQGRHCMIIIRDLIAELQYVSDKEELNQIHNLMIDRGQDLNKFVEVSEGLLDGMEKHIKEAFTKTSDINEMSELIDTNTRGLAAIAEQQMATSEEFSNMAILLKEQAVMLDDKISVFKIK